MSRVPKPELQAIFDERTASIFHGMLARVSPRVSATGRVLRAGREIPFALPDLRCWVLGRFGGSVAGVVQCAYCNDWLNIQTLCIDHAVPIAGPWYGSLGLGNLACACRSCNQRKGRMSAEGFRRLVGWGCRELDQRDFRDMLGRMANGGAYLKVKWGKEARVQPAEDLAAPSLF